MQTVKRLQDWLPNGQTAALVATEHNRRYFTGFPATDGYVLATKDNVWFMTDSRYIEAAQNAIKHMEVLCYDKAMPLLLELMQKSGVKTVLIEAELPVCEVRRMREGLAPMSIDDSNTLDDEIGGLRMVKTEEELVAVRRAQALTDAGFAYILPRIAIGRTEREVALDLEFEIRRQGAEGVAFEFIVVSGVNSSLPHGVPGDKKIEKGDFITLDFGAKVDGYCSDMTRTVIVGEPNDRQREIYDTVLKAQLASLATVAPGVLCRDADAAARDVITAAGYGERFGHGTGHGVGVQIHEQPRLSPAAPADLRLAVGNLVTVEPGIYIPGEGGVRIEDMVVVTPDGCENLTKSPKELIIL